MVGRSTRSLDVMRTGAGDWLSAVELVMAIEEQLEDELPRRFPKLKPYLVPVSEATCIKGGLTTEVAVFGRRNEVVLFASLESAQFGVGEIAAVSKVRNARFYPTLEMAARSFLGTGERPHDI